MSVLNLANKTILIVDDHQTNIKLLADYLQFHGLTILVALDGKTAITTAKEKNPDLILLDVMMPGMDGFETCQHLKADPDTVNIPVIFMTALEETSYKIAGFEAGAVDYVTKPFQIQEVLARISTHLRLRELTERLEQIVGERTAELNKAYHNLEQLDQAKSAFIEVVSHELRTPLAIIDGYSQILGKNPTLIEKPDTKGLVDGILAGTQRMLDIVNHILDATQIDSDVLHLIMTDQVLAVIFGGIRKKLKGALEERNLTLNLDKSLAVLPPIQADGELLFKALYQVIVNAVKYTPDGGTIEVKGRFIQPHAVEIAVCDYGIGIDEKHLELIFEKFYQTGQATLHSSGKTSFKGGGPGLGLAITKGIIDVHHGRIWAESQGYDEAALHGSQFIIELPVKQPTALT